MADTPTSAPPLRPAVSRPRIAASRGLEPGPPIPAALEPSCAFRCSRQSPDSSPRANLLCARPVDTCRVAIEAGRADRSVRVHGRDAEAQGHGSKTLRRPAVVEPTPEVVVGRATPRRGGVDREETPVLAAERREGCRERTGRRVAGGRVALSLERARANARCECRKAAHPVGGFWARVGLSLGARGAPKAASDPPVGCRAHGRGDARPTLLRGGGWHRPLDGELGSPLRDPGCDGPWCRSGAISPSRARELSERPARTARLGPTSRGNGQGDHEKRGC